MKNIKSVLFTLAAVGLTTGCGGGGGASSSASGSLPSGSTNSIYAGTWSSPVNICFVTGDSTFPRASLVTRLSDSNLVTTFTFYTDTACASVGLTYKMSSAYTIGSANVSGNGYNVDSHVVSQVVNVTNSSIISALNSGNAPYASQCGVTFVSGDNDVTNKICYFTPNGFGSEMDQQTYSIVWVDQTHTPNRMYSGTNSTGHNGLTSAQRHVVFDSSYVERQ